MVANALKALSVDLDLILTSPYKRARQTAEVFSESFNCELQDNSRLAPGVAVKSFIESLQNYQSKDSLMLVGHEPDMGVFARRRLNVIEADLVEQGPSRGRLSRFRCVGTKSRDEGLQLLHLVDFLFVGIVALA